MLKLKFRKIIATTADIKLTNFLVDCGSIHHYLHSKSSFLTYERMTLGSDKLTSGKSIVVWRGFVKLPIDGGIIVETNHTSFLTTNIDSV